METKKEMLKAIDKVLDLDIGLDLLDGNTFTGLTLIQEQIKEELQTK